MSPGGTRHSALGPAGVSDPVNADHRVFLGCPAGGCSALRIRPARIPGICEGLMPQQGPNYALAKRFAERASPGRLCGTGQSRQVRCEGLTGCAPARTFPMGGANDQHI